MIICVELLNSVRHLWNGARALLNADTRMVTSPPPPVVWELGPFPEPPAAPESLIAPAAGEKGAKGKGEQPRR